MTLDGLITSPLFSHDSFIIQQIQLPFDVIGSAAKLAHTSSELFGQFGQSAGAKQDQDQQHYD
jgi:hypothetical protein